MATPEIVLLVAPVFTGVVSGVILYFITRWLDRHINK